MEGHLKRKRWKELKCGIIGDANTLLKKDNKKIFKSKLS